MGLATHLGPWLLGTVRSTTGTTAGTIRNIGAAPVIQTKTIAFGDGAATVAAVLPAGAMIQNMQLITPVTAFGAGSIVISVAGVAYSTSVTLPTALGVSAITVATTGAAVANNVGATDAIVTYTLTSATLGSATLVIAYVVRQPDGSYTPTAFTGP